MSASNQFSLILGCGGYKHHTLSLCSGTTNAIINFNRHFDAVELEQIMNFLDYTCGLFDRPIGDWNKITNILKMFREKYNLIDDKMWEALYVWLPHHKRCGGYLKLIFNADIKVLSQEDLVIPYCLKR